MQSRQFRPLAENTDQENQVFFEVQSKFINVTLSIFLYLMTSSSRDDNTPPYDLLFFIFLTVIALNSKQTPLGMFNMWRQSKLTDNQPNPIELRNELDALLKNFELLTEDEIRLCSQRDILKEDENKLKFYDDITYQIIHDPVELKVTDGKGVIKEIHEREFIEKYLQQMTDQGHMVLKDIFDQCIITQLVDDIFDAVANHKDVRVKAFDPNTKKEVQGVIPYDWANSLKQLKSVEFNKRTINLARSPYRRIILEITPIQTPALRKQHAEFISTLRTTLSEIKPSPTKISIV